MTAEPDHDCRLCTRLRDFVLEQRKANPGWHNGPVQTLYPPEGPSSVNFLIVGLAPGLRGANRTGIPFIGDSSGDLLYEVLHRHDLAGPRPDAGIAPRLKATAITNAVRCVPPANKPVGAEINTCRQFLTASIRHMEKLDVIMTLGKVSHESTIRALGGKISDHPFGHATQTAIKGVSVFSSYHCSRYNLNTGRLTPEMFDEVVWKVSQSLATSQSIA